MIMKLSLKLPAAVFFDFDGVIVDTEPSHYAAFQRVLAPLGLSFSWDQYERQYIGFDDRGVFRAIFSAAGQRLDRDEELKLITAKGKAFAELCKIHVPTLLPGVVDWLSSLKERVPLALCSGALPSDIHPILDHWGVAECFDVFVTAADVNQSKPDPESYLLAHGRLSKRFPKRLMPPDQCAAIEDTEVGIAAARAAGLRVIHVARRHGEQRGDHVWRVPSLEHVTPEIVGAWCAS